MYSTGRQSAKRVVAQAAWIGLLFATVWLSSQHLCFGQPPQAQHEQVARLHWKLGTLARDQQGDPILAAQHFYQAADAARLAGKTARSQSYLIAATHQASAVDRFLTQPVEKAVFNRDGSRLLTYSLDDTVWLWDPAQPQPLAKLTHPGPVAGAVYSSDSKKILTYGDGGALVWEADGTLLRTFRHEQPVVGARFSDNAARVLTWSGDAARLWNVMDETEPQQAFEHVEKVRFAAFNEDETRVITCGDDNTARLWDARSGKLMHKLDHKKGDALDEKLYTGVFRAWFADKEKLIVTSGAQGIWVWDAKTGERVRRFHGSNPVVGPDGSHCATWDGKKAALWSVHEDEPVRRFKAKLDFHGAILTGEDEPTLLSWHYDAYYFRGPNGHVCLWDIEKGEPRQIYWHDDYVRGARFTADQSGVVTWSRDGTVRLWDRKQTHKPRLLRHAGDVLDVTLSPDGNVVLARLRDKTARLWGLSGPALDAPQRVIEHDDLPITATLSADGARLIASTGYGNKIRYWELDQDRPVRTFELVDERDVIAVDKRAKRFFAHVYGQGAWVWDVDKEEPLLTIDSGERQLHARLNADGTRLFVWSGNKAWLYDVDAGRLLESLDKPYRVQTVAFFEDSLRVLSWHNFTEAVEFWDPHQDRPLQTFPHEKSVLRAVLSDDAKQILSWSSGELLLWDAAHGERPKQRFNHAIFSVRGRSNVSGAVFSPQGNRFLVWIGSGHLQLWDIEGSEPLRQFHVTGSARYPVFTADGNRFVTGSTGKISQLWDVDHEEPLRTFHHSGTVKMSDDGARVLTIGSRQAMLWDVSVDAKRIAEQRKQYEAKTNTVLTDEGSLRVVHTAK